MSRKLLIPMCMLVCLPVVVTAQSRETAPRTSWGAPDLQGVYDFGTATPFQRPLELEGRSEFTAEEAAVQVQRNAEQFAEGFNTENLVPPNYNNFWFDRGAGVVDGNRTSLITSPENGRVPALQPGVEMVTLSLGEDLPGTQPVRVRAAGIGADHWQDRGLAERCLLGFNSGPPIVPAGYNQNLQIFQTPDHVVIFTEQNNNPPRIISLDARSPMSENIRQYPGDSRGHWEGDTLVIESSHFNDRSAWEGSSRDLKVLERFTRVSDDRIHYEFTVEDPATWDQPWSAEIPMMATEGPMYEYACHEGNHDIRHIQEVYRNIELQEAPETR